MTPPGDEMARLIDELQAARGRITELEAELHRLRSELAEASGSASARMAAAAVRRVRRVIPPESRRQEVLHKATTRTLALVDRGPGAVAGLIRRDRELRRAIGVADTAAARRRQYRRWLGLHTPTAHDLAVMRRESQALTNPLVISLVMPVHNPDQAWLEAAIDSVLSQAYPHFELCIADDASTQGHVRVVLERAAADARVRVTYREQQGGIAAASNSALALASGDYVGFIDHDDALRPHALFAMAAYVREHPDADLVYSDEDKLSPDGDFGAPTFKPDFSPDRLLAENYINHFTVVRRSVAGAVGGFREGFDGSQDHDLMLRVSEQAAHVGHVADVLYGWRMAAGSTAVSAASKPLAQDAGRRAVADALQRRGLDGHVDLGPSPGLYVPRYTVRGAPDVDVMVVARDQADGDECQANLERLSRYAARQVRVVLAGKSTAASINTAVRGSDRNHIVVVDASVRVMTPDWIEVLLELSQREDIGAVAPRLHYPDGAVAHEGMIIGRLGLATSVNQHLHVIKEMGAVSGACLMTRRAVFEEAGGFDEAFGRTLFDVDYCMRVRVLGLRVLCTPLAALTWGDAGPAGAADTTGSDARVFAQRWGGVGEVEDPYLNPNVLWPTPLSLRFN
jgi:GT2 family glycosyltransferase